MVLEQSRASYICTIPDSMITETVENYLKALFTLADEEGRVSVSDLSQCLEVSKPSANSMAKTLHQEGFVVYEKYKPLVLTKKGRKAAALVIRRHRLTEMFLVEMMGFAWDEVHDVAEQIEHVQAPSFFDRMYELMDFPKFDPHGSPIPDKEGNIVEANCISLTACAKGDKVTLVGLAKSSRALLQLLDGHNIALHQVLEVATVEDFDHSMVLNRDGFLPLTLSKQVCNELLVRVEN